MKTRRTKPFVCVDVDYADHARFQKTIDLDAAAGTWLRCLAHSRAQEQDGLVTQAWLRRTFPATQHRVDELVAVGLLLRRDDGDYELRSYAPRNQTRTMIEEERVSARERMSARRAAVAESRRVTPNNRRTNGEQSPNERRTDPNTFSSRIATDNATHGSGSTRENASPHSKEARASLGASEPPSLLALASLENTNIVADFDAVVAEDSPNYSDPVTPNNHRTNGEQPANERRTNAFVPTSTSINTYTSSPLLSSSTSSSLVSSLSPTVEDLTSGDISGENVISVPRACADAGVRASPGARVERSPLPASERSLAGSFWLTAFTDGIREGTGRTCTTGRVYLDTLERIVAHHAPERDAPSACAWLKAQAKAFAARWDGKHAPKGLTPDGLERWLNEGRPSPPEFGRQRIVQLPADEWHEDDWSDLGARVDS